MPAARSRPWARRVGPCGSTGEALTAFARPATRTRPDAIEPAHARTSRPATRNWRDGHGVTRSRALAGKAIAAFLKSRPPVSNKVKNFGPKEPVTIGVSAVLPPNVYNALPPSQK